MWSPGHRNGGDHRNKNDESMSLLSIEMDGFGSIGGSICQVRDNHNYNYY